MYLRDAAKLYYTLMSGDERAGDSGGSPESESQKIAAQQNIPWGSDGGSESEEQRRVKRRRTSGQQENYSSAVAEESKLSSASQTLPAGFSFGAGKRRVPTSFVLNFYEA
jgi:hypothetical protein